MEVSHQKEGVSLDLQSELRKKVLSPTKLKLSKEVIWPTKLKYPKKEFEKKNGKTRLRKKRRMTNCRF